MQKVLESFKRAIKVNKKKGFTLIELLIVIVIIGILAALATREYSKYIERANLSSYALPLARDCFLELAEYCASNPGATSISLGTNSTCKKLTVVDNQGGIDTDKGKVTISGLPTTCSGTVPNYTSNIDVKLSTATKYKLECVPKNIGENAKTPECSPKAL